jgi:hypothetical protein
MISGQKKRTDDTKAKRKGHLSFSFGLCIICPFLLTFVSSCPFFLAFVSSVLFYWPLHHLFFSVVLCFICPFLLVFVSSEKSTDDTKAKRKGQMIQRPKEKDR